MPCFISNFKASGTFKVNDRFDLSIQEHRETEFPIYCTVKRIIQGMVNGISHPDRYLRTEDLTNHAGSMGNVVSYCIFWHDGSAHLIIVEIGLFNEPLGVTKGHNLQEKG